MVDTVTYEKFTDPRNAAKVNQIFNLIARGKESIIPRDPALRPFYNTIIRANQAERFALQQAAQQAAQSRIPTAAEIEAGQSLLPEDRNRPTATEKKLSQSLQPSLRLASAQEVQAQQSLQRNVVIKEEIVGSVRNPRTGTIAPSKVIVVEDTQTGQTRPATAEEQKEFFQQTRGVLQGSESKRSIPSKIREIKGGILKEPTDIRSTAKREQEELSKETLANIIGKGISYTPPALSLKLLTTKEGGKELDEGLFRDTGRFAVALIPTTRKDIIITGAIFATGGIVGAATKGSSIARPILSKRFNQLIYGTGIRAVPQAESGAFAKVAGSLFKGTARLTTRSIVATSLGTDILTKSATGDIEGLAGTTRNLFAFGSGATLGAKGTAALFEQRTTIEVLRDVKEPVLQGKVLPVIKDGKADALVSLTIKGETLPPRIKVTTTGIRKLLGIKPVSQKELPARPFSIETPSPQFISDPLILRRVRGAKGTPTIFQTELIDSSKINLLKEATSLKGIPKFLLEGQAKKAGVIRFEGTKASVSIGETVDITQPLGRRTSLTQSLSLSTETLSTDKFAVEVGRVTYKDISFPFARARGKTRSIRTEILTKKEPVVLDKDEDFSIVSSLSGGKKTPFSKTFEEVKTDVVKSIAGALPKTPKTPKIKTLSSPTNQKFIPTIFGGGGLINQGLRVTTRDPEFRDLTLSGNRDAGAFFTGSRQGARTKDSFDSADFSKLRADLSSGTLSIPKSIQVSIQVPKEGSKVIEKQITKKISPPIVPPPIKVPRVPSVPKSTTKQPPFFRFTTTPSSRRFKEAGFTVAVKRGSAFRAVSTTSSLERALTIGSGLGKTFKVTQTTGGQLREGFRTPKGFTALGGGIFREERRRGLGRKSEKALLTGARFI